MRFTNPLARNAEIGMRRRAVLAADRALFSFRARAMAEPAFIVATLLFVLAALFLPVKLALAAPLFMGSTKANQRIELAFTENGTTDTRIPRGTLFSSLTIDVPWTSTVATDATAVRTRGAPIKNIQFLGDGNKVYYSAKLQDIVRMDELFSPASLAQILTSPSGVTAAGGPYTGRVKLTIPFEMRHAFAGDLTALASWRITKDPTLRVNWGSHAEVYRGGTGSTAVTAGAAFITLSSIEGFDTRGMSVNAFGDALGVKVESYDELTYTAALNGITNSSKQQLPNSADIRAIVITGEDTNGDPLTEAEMAKISFDFIENTYSRIQAGINLGSLRAINASKFSYVGGLPAGVAVLDFADDMDILHIYEATKKNKVELAFTTAVPASGTYTLRVHTIGIEPGRAVTVGKR